MKRLIIISLAVICLLSSASCSRIHLRRHADQIDSTMLNLPIEEKPWLKMDPLDIEMKPVKSFSRDWMALATGNSKSMNCMTISWGTIGELWGKPVVIVYVSSDRYTKALMDKNAYFTVSSFPDNLKNREMLSYIGSHSQQTEQELYPEDKTMWDKTKNSGLLVEFSELGNPLFKQSDFAIECKKLYSDEFKKTLMPDDVRHLYDELGVHTFYIGEIVNVFFKNPDVPDESTPTEEAQ